MNALSGGHFSDEDAVAAGRAAFDAAAAARCLTFYANLTACPGGSAEGYALRDACKAPLRGLVLEGGVCSSRYDAPSECADGFCDSRNDGCPGRCRAWPANGNCYSYQCRPGAWCGPLSIQNMCIPLGEIGVDCDSTDHCRPGLACLEHYSQAGPKGRCGAPLQSGASCIGSQECAAGLYCGGLNQPHTCDPLSREGETCSGEVGCSMGLVCFQGDPPWFCRKPSDVRNPTTVIGVACAPGACGGSFSGVLYCDDGSNGHCQPSIGLGKPCVPPANGGDNPCALGTCDPVARVCAVTCM